MCNIFNPVATLTHFLLRVLVFGQGYQFVAMTMSLATVTWGFTTLVKEVRKIALRLGISVYMY